MTHSRLCPPCGGRVMVIPLGERHGGRNPWVRVRVSRHFVAGALCPGSGTTLEGSPRWPAKMAASPARGGA